MALQMLENYDLKSYGHGSYTYYHLMIEALKLGFRDRNSYLTDPAFAEIPLERLLSSTYAKELQLLLSWMRPALSIRSLSAMIRPMRR